VRRKEPREPGSEQQPFRTEVQPERDGVRVVLIGELDLATAAQLDEQLRELRAVGFQRFVLDLRQLAFIDSTGVRLIMRVNELAENDGIDLTVLQGPEHIRRVFELTGLTDVLPFRP
jgi:anti-anti-sigma factor